VQDLAGQRLGSVSTLPTAEQSRGCTLAVTRGEGLGGTFWTLSLLATVCLDIVLLRRQKGPTA
jgi:hypothetical protein